MKRIITTLLLLTLFSCGEVEYRYKEVGELTSLRIDDDSEYHFSTDNIVENDIFKDNIYIQRGSDKPTLYIKQGRCKNGICNSHNKEWKNERYSWKIVLPYDYKIETFED